MAQRHTVHRLPLFNGEGQDVSVIAEILCKHLRQLFAALVMILHMQKGNPAL